ncbi:MAG: type I methionyl aminopeptidase, partial [Chlamydiae bacterium]|nr:type I methionyl aminopeptidase [Chlamydiota bacterium]
MIYIKTEKEIELMRKGGKILALILNELEKAAVAGVTAADLNDKAAVLCK